MTHDEEREASRLRKSAVDAVEAYGLDQYRLGFAAALPIALMALRWATTSGTISKRRLAAALAASIREACARAGVEVPREVAEVKDNSAPATTAPR